MLPFVALALALQAPGPLIENADEKARHFGFNHTNAFPNYTIYDYGKDCYEAMGVPLPSIHCNEGSLLEVTQNGVPITDHVAETCDKPTLLLPYEGNTPLPITQCVPGNRLKKVTQGDVVTIALCRHIPKKGTLDINTPIFENIAIIQLHKTRRNVCWFQIRKHETGFDARPIPRPYEPHRIKGDSEDRKATALYEPPGVLSNQESCIKCHDGQIWLRPPYVSQIKYSPDPEVRKNAVPDDETPAPYFHVGKAFAVWNSPSSQPHRIRIQNVYDEVFPLSAEDRNQLPASTCTQCHSIGKSPLVKENRWEGTCGNFIREWIYPEKEKSPIATRRSSLALQPSRFFWMPPGHREESQSKYRRALEALRRCCENPDLRSGAGEKVCVE